MNLHLYKVWRIDDSDPNDPCESVIVMTEKDLCKEFVMIYNEGGIPQELLTFFKEDDDYKNENWNDIENLRIGTMIDIMNEICNYISGVGYYITETDVEIELNPATVVKWINTLNYWEDDIRDIAEKFDYKYNMYEKYNEVINEIYRLKKGV